MARLATWVAGRHYVREAEAETEAKEWSLDLLRVDSADPPSQSNRCGRPTPDSPTPCRDPFVSWSPDIDTDTFYALSM